MIQSVNVFNMDLEPVLVADRHPKNASMMKLFETTKKKVLVAKKLRELLGYLQAVWLLILHAFLGYSNHQSN